MANPTRIWTDVDYEKPGKQVGWLNLPHSVTRSAYTRNWRAFFDLYADGPEPVELRCFLRLGERTLTETWLYQHHPFAYADF